MARGRRLRRDRVKLFLRQVGSEAEAGAGAKRTHLSVKRTCRRRIVQGNRERDGNGECMKLDVSIPSVVCNAGAKAEAICFKKPLSRDVQRRGRGREGGGGGERQRSYGVSVMRCQDMECARCDATPRNLNHL